MLSIASLFSLVHWILLPIALAELSQLNLYNMTNIKVSKLGDTPFNQIISSLIMHNISLLHVIEETTEDPLNQTQSSGLKNGHIISHLY